MQDHVRATTVYLTLLCLFACLFANQPAAHADGGAPNLAYIAGGDAGISVIDVAQRRVVRTLPLADSPAMIQLNSDGSTLFIVQPAQNRALVVDAATGKIRCQATAPGQPSLLTLSTQEDGFFVAGNGDTHVREFDPHACTLLRSISVPGPVYGLTTALDGGVFPTHTGLYQLCVATTNQVIIFDPDGKQLASYPVSAKPRYLSAPPLDFAIYVTTQQGSVVVIDLRTNRVTPPLLSGGTFGPMDYDETTHEVYVPDMQHQQVDVIAYKAQQSNQAQTPKALLRVFPMDSVPVAVAITNDGQLGFIALQNGHVVMLDLPGRQALQTFTVGGNPHFIITGVYPPRPLPDSAQPAQTAATYNAPLLALFSVIFLLALGGLIIMLRIVWKQRH